MYACLIALVVAHVVFTAFVRSTIPPPIRADTAVENGLLAFSQGVVFAQPLLIALFAALWPAAQTTRFVWSTALLALLVYASILCDVSWYGRASASSAMIPILQFLGCQVVLRLLAKARGWRIVAPWALDATSHRQFSVGALLRWTAVVGVLLAIGRWLAPMVNWPSLVDGWSYAPIVAGVATLCSLPMLPAIGMVMGNERRSTATNRRVLLVAFTAVAMCSFFFLDFGCLIVGVLLLWFVGAYSSFVISLVVLRGCGYRLARYKLDADPTQETIVGS
ncbi:MAG: hypothetical protein WD845_12180 [Pirellulales bacterium]